jgi:heterodisulfide reductase subunit A
MAKAKKSREGAVMVLGGGIAGVQAALDLTDLGYYVYLVEKSPAIGGVPSRPTTVRSESWRPSWLRPVGLQI